MNRICLQCNKLFSRKSSVSKKEWEKYYKVCSMACNYKFYKRTPPSQKGKDPWNKDKKGVMPTPWNKGRPASEKTKEILAKYSVKGICNNTGKTHFPKGHAPVFIRDIKGDKNFNWKGGVSKLHKTERQLAMETPQYKNWRKAVFERDNFTCLGCGKHGGNMEADHIKPWVLYPELRYTLANGRTLCKACHRVLGWTGPHLPLTTDRKRSIVKTSKLLTFM